MAVGDGALGFWAAVREVWPETREQACWCHKLANVLDKLPQRLQPRAKRTLHQMMYAASRADCEAAGLRCAAEYQTKYPKAVESLVANWERLVSFFDFPAEHWKHLRTTNVIESPFATVRLREWATRGAGSRTNGLLMAFKPLDMAQMRRRRLDRAYPLAGPCRREVHGWSGRVPTKELYSLKRQPTLGSRLIMTGLSTTFDKYSARGPDHLLTLQH